VIVSSLAIHQLITLARSRIGPPGEDIGSRPESATPPVSGRAGDCATESEFGSLEQAMRTRKAHTGHLPLCRQYLAAIAYLSGVSTTPTTNIQPVLEMTASSPATPELLPDRPRPG
jgi:hypothetical protein